jgi:hypothetical protein
MVVKCFFQPCRPVLDGRPSLPVLGRWVLGALKWVRVQDKRDERERRPLF